MMNKFISALSLFSLTACAMSLAPEQQALLSKDQGEAVFANDVRRGAQVDSVCFTSEIDSFERATDRAIVLMDGEKKYLVTTQLRCSDLDNAKAVGVDSFSPCLRNGDKLISSDRVFTGRNLQPDFATPLSARQNTHLGPQSCFVDKIYEWDREPANLAEQPNAELSRDG